MLEEDTLLKTAYHFLLLLVGFDTLTYQKGYNRSPTLVGHQPWSAIVGGGGVNLYFYRLGTASNVFSMKDIDT